MSRKKQRQLSPAQAKKLDEVKLILCGAVRRAMARTYRPTLDAIALQLGTSRARVVLVQRGETQHVTFNQLFRFLVQLEPHFEFYVGRR